MKKILLIGIHGVYNYGCEAIVRGTFNQIKSVYPNAIVEYASVRLSDDKRRLESCDISLVDLKLDSRYSFKNITRKLCSMIGISYEYTHFRDVKDLLSSYDVVFSIGGDMYTLDDQGGYSTSLSMLGNICSDLNIPYVIWGCSIGPFDTNKAAEQYYCNHLRSIKSIVARENETVEYLSKLGIKDNVIFAPDPAYYVREISDFRKIDLSDNLVIGINLSPLSAKYHYNDIEQALSVQASEIDKIIEQLHCKVILIPHVHSHDLNDDDQSYLSKVYNQIKNKPAVTLVTSDLGFLGIQSEIQKCDVTLSTRMHCNVNSIVSGIPTIFIAYSQKAKGMAEFVYGNDDFMIGITEFKADVIWEKIQKLSSIELKIKHKIEDFDLECVLKDVIE